MILKQLDKSLDLDSDQETQSMDPVCLERLRAEGLKSLVDYLQRYRTCVSEGGYFTYIYQGLLDPDSYPSFNKVEDKEPCICDVANAEIVINRDNPWPRDLRFFLEESNSWLIAFIYDEFDRRVKKDSLLLRDFIKGGRQDFCLIARRKGFERAKRLRKHRELYEHFEGFLTDYLDSLGCDEENRKRALDNLGLLYRSL